jgi:hypothetical protein
MPKAKVNASIEERLSQAQVAITNVMADPDLSATMARFGYAAEQLQQGSRLRDNLHTLYDQQRGAYGDLFTANDDFWSVHEQADDIYMRYVKVARVALEHDRGGLKKLDLMGERKHTLAGWLAQVRQFYSNALADPAILSKLATVSITQAMLEAGKLQVDALATQNADRKQFKGGARNGTKTRNDAVAALDEWMSDFMKIARVALKDRPQFLAKLGVAATARATARTANPTANHTANHTATSEAAPVEDPAAPVPES